MSDENNQQPNNKVWVVVILFIVLIAFIAYKKICGH
jgi:hypothetical protein